MQSSEALVRAISEKAVPIGLARSLEPLIDRVKNARIVMLGEASHGTHEFYEWRRIISEWLMVKHGFRFIAVEGDWPPCAKVDRYVRRLRATSTDDSARAVLTGFNRWPTWMWANTEIIRLAEWLRSHNGRVPEDQLVGFHGLDVYSLYESIEEVLRLLDRINPFLARRARRRYECFSRFGRDERAYARSLIGTPEGCTQEVVQTLRDVLELRLSDGDSEDIFDTQQNARIVHGAEQYYRAMMHADEASWNVRDRHMLDTLDRLLERYGTEARAVVWAHNSHIGDARHTDMAAAGLVNLGQLARERYGDEAVALVGFGTYHGRVIASHSWDGPIQNMEVPLARPDSLEAAFHRVSEDMGSSRLYLTFDRADRRGPLGEWHGHRAVGVVYDPVHERRGNYVPTRLAARYDAFVHIDESRAIEPLIQEFDSRELPETWPVGQ